MLIISQHWGSFFDLFIEIAVRMRSLLLLGLGCVLLGVIGTDASKYSAELNAGANAKLMALENPFRMQKINLLWEKAKRRLSDGKLTNIYSDLKSQDKDELKLKKLKSEGQDKDGIKEAELRKTLQRIMNKYGLNDPWSNPDDNKTFRDDGKYELEQDTIDKRIFKDKKLNKLWNKAEKAGLDLETLKQEFQHHQEKIEHYHQLIDKVNQPMNGKEEEELMNSIDRIVEETGDGKISKTANQPIHQMLKEKHKEIKQGYDDLLKRVQTGGDGEFEEIAVQKLWDMAKKANFSQAELLSLKEELHHYEHRMKKLRHFQAELDLADNKMMTNKYIDESVDHQKHLKRKVKEMEYKVSKAHGELQNRIIARHSEL